MYFIYGSKEVEYLKSKDKVLGGAHRSDWSYREGDRYGSVLLCGTSYHRSADFHKSADHDLEPDEGKVWGGQRGNHFRRRSGRILQSLGMTFRKAEYITDFAEKVHSGAFDLEEISEMSDEDAIKALASLKGIGVWTAEMILLFCLQRPDIFSYDDLAIQRGLRMVYHHRKIDRKLFEKYRRRFSPYCSVASLYLWAVAGGAVPRMKDYAPQSKAGRKKI